MPLSQDTLNALAPISNGFKSAQYSDFLTLLNSNPAYVKALNDFVAAGGSFAVSFDAPDANGEYVPPATGPNANNGLISLNPGLSPSGIWSVGYAIAETIAHELGHTSDQTIGADNVAAETAQGGIAAETNLFVNSEATADEFAYALMEPIGSYFVENPTLNVVVAGGALFSVFYYTGFPTAENALTDGQTIRPWAGIRPLLLREVSSLLATRRQLQKTRSRLVAN